MPGKKITFCLAVLVWLSGQALAINRGIINLDSGGTILGWEQNGTTLQLYDSLTNQHRIFYNFTTEVTTLQLVKDNAKYYLIDNTSGEVNLQTLAENGQLLSPPQLLSSHGQEPALIVKNGQSYAAWVENKGLAFSFPGTLSLTDEALSTPRIIITENDQIQLAFVAAKELGHRQRIVFTAFNPLTIVNNQITAETQTLFETQDQIVNLQLKTLNEVLFVSWQEVYGDRWTSFFTLSLDNGQTFRAPIAFQFANELLSLGFINSHFTAVSFSDQPICREIVLSPPIAPQISALPKQANFVISNPLVPLRLKAELATSQTFTVNVTRQINYTVGSSSGESLTLNLPTDLVDGNYWLRLTAFDGIQNSPLGPATTFKIDHRPPQLVTIEGTRFGPQLTLKGELSEVPASLSINKQPVIIDSTKHFQQQLDLESGNNIITLLMSDEAGNWATTTWEAFYNTISPEITVKSPSGSTNNWVRAGASIIIEALVFDLHNDLADETEATLTLDGQPLSETLYYNSEDQSLTGIVSLPSSLNDGQHQLKLALTDQAGQQGETIIPLSIDSQPPLLTIDSSNRYLVKNSQTFSLPVTDSGSGVDPQGTILKINSLIPTAIMTREGQGLRARFATPLAEGSYEAEIRPRDLVGNTSEAKTFTLIVDLTASATLIRTIESTRNGGLIANFAYGPNPFSPNKVGPSAFSADGKGMVFTYALAQPADVKIRIYDLTGTLIWIRDVRSTASGVTTWSGTDQFGQMATNGIYPYFFTAAAGGLSETRRGKIIVTQ